MKTKFIDEGIAVILGEYGAIARTNIAGHEQYREYYLDYVTESAQSAGLVPFYWDNGDQGQNGFAIFERSTGEILYPEMVEALIGNDN